MNEEKNSKHISGWWALSPLFVFLCLYLVTSIIVNDFYKVPITVAFLVSSCYAIAITRRFKAGQRCYQFSVGASNKNIMLMIWIFILAGAFASKRKEMGAIDATVNLTITHSSRQFVIGWHLYSFLFHLPFYRNQCRNDCSPYSCCYWPGTKNRHRSSVYGSYRCRWFLFW